jgi:hypothetical protein
MYLNIQGVLQFQIYQIPMVGADTCGFSKYLTDEDQRPIKYLKQMTTLMRSYAIVGCSSRHSLPSIGTTTPMVLSLKSLTAGKA